MKNLNENYNEMKKMLKGHFSKDEAKAVCLNVVVYKIKRTFVFERQMSRFFSLRGSYYSCCTEQLKLCLFKLDLYLLVYLLLPRNK